MDDLLHRLLSLQIFPMLFDLYDVMYNLHYMALAGEATGIELFNNSKHLADAWIDSRRVVINTVHNFGFIEDNVGLINAFFD